MLKWGPIESTLGANFRFRNIVMKVLVVVENFIEAFSDIFWIEQEGLLYWSCLRLVDT